MVVEKNARTESYERNGQGDLPMLSMEMLAESLKEKAAEIERFGVNVPGSIESYIQEKLERAGVKDTTLIYRLIINGARPIVADIETQTDVVLCEKRPNYERAKQALSRYRERQSRKYAEQALHLRFWNAHKFPAPILVYARYDALDVEGPVLVTNFVEGDPFDAILGSTMTSLEARIVEKARLETLQHAERAASQSGEEALARTENEIMDLERKRDEYLLKMLRTASFMDHAGTHYIQNPQAPIDVMLKAHLFSEKNMRRKGHYRGLFRELARAIAVWDAVAQKQFPDDLVGRVRTQTLPIFFRDYTAKKENRGKKYPQYVNEIVESLDGLAEFLAAPEAVGYLYGDPTWSNFILGDVDDGKELAIPVDAGEVYWGRHDLGKSLILGPAQLDDERLHKLFEESLSFDREFAVQYPIQQTIENGRHETSFYLNQFFTNFCTLGFGCKDLGNTRYGSADFGSGSINGLGVYHPRVLVPKAARQLMRDLDRLLPNLDSSARDAFKRFKSIIEGYDGLISSGK